MKNRKGISLIVLVITILVMIILAGVVVVTMQNNNPITKAKEATFKSNVKTYIEELSVTVANRLAIGNIEKINESTNVSLYIPSFAKKDAGKFVIEDSKLVYVGNSLEEELAAEDAGCIGRGIKQTLYDIQIPVEKQKIDGLNGTNIFKLGKSIDLDDNVVIEFSAKPTREVRLDNLTNINYDKEPVNLLVNPHNGYFVKEKQNAAGIGVVLGTNGIAVAEHADSWYPYKAIYKADLSGRHNYKIVMKNNTIYVYVDGVKVAEEKEEKYDLIFSNNKDMFAVGKGFYTDTYLNKYGYYVGELYSFKVSTAAN